MTGSIYNYRELWYTIQALSLFGHYVCDRLFRSSLELESCHLQYIIFFEYEYRPMASLDSISTRYLIKSIQSM
jgi:hypothetical protein